MRAATFLATIALLSVLIVSLVLLDGKRAVARNSAREANIALVKVLQLTDLALWTEARYTRHPSQADYFTPFQSSLSALEHFPSGSWVLPPFGRKPILPGSRSPGNGDEKP